MVRPIRNTPPWPVRVPAMMALVTIGVYVYLCTGRRAPLMAWMPHEEFAFVALPLIALQTLLLMWVMLAWLLASFRRDNVEAVIWAGAGAGPLIAAAALLYFLKADHERARYGAGWLVCAALVAFCASLWGANLVKRRRAMAGRCAKCRYDRSGLAVGVKCPECGAPTSPASPAPT